MAGVEVRRLTKQFREVSAVDGLDLEIRDGEYMVLLGPSGCGKTTLLRLIAGLEEPSTGEVWIGERNVTWLPPRARKVAMVFQSYALYPHKTVLDNIVFPLKAEKLPPDRRREKAQWAAELLGIGKLLGRKPRQLSGGERQRVALARALVREPDVFLLDEPLSNLDAKLRASARDDLRQFQQQMGATTVYVTHDQVEALALGDRIAVMEKGRILQAGTPHEIYHNPADTFVATFVGSPPMNLLVRQDLILGFRPEALVPESLADVSDPAIVLEVRLEREEYLGAERHLIGSVDAGGTTEKVRSVLPSRTNVDLDAGKIHRFVVAPLDLKTFDKATGKRVSPERVAQPQ